MKILLSLLLALSVQANKQKENAEDFFTDQPLYVFIDADYSCSIEQFKVAKSKFNNCINNPIFKDCYAEAIIKSCDKKFIERVLR